MINKILSKVNCQVSKIFPRSFEKVAIKGKDLIGVEIGVYKGEHAESLLKNLSIKKLYLIDPYETYTEYPDSINHYGKDQDTLEEAKKIAHQKLSKYKNIIWFNDYSSDIHKIIPNDLDFVYIDGNHEYEFVKQDLLNYYPKLKKGGVIGGHDFDSGWCNEHLGVVKAVIEFVVNNKLNLYIRHPDFWIVKE